MTENSEQGAWISTVADIIFAGGGEMGALMRAHDWSTSPLGLPETWPQSLRSAVGLMLANKHLMFVAWGPELTFLYNDGYRPVFGAKHPWALGRPFREVWSEIWDDLKPLIDTALNGEATWSENLPLVMERNGYPEECWFTFSYSPIRDESGAIAGMFCAGAETTQTVIAQTALGESEARFRNMADHAPAMMWVTDADGSCTYLNRAWYEFTGQSENEGEGFGWLEAVHPDDRGWSGEAFVAANAAQGPFRVEYRLRRHDGEHRWAIDAASPRFGPQGEFLGYIGSVIDIDERREMEDALRDLNETLEQRVAERTAERDRMWDASPDLLLVIDFDGVFQRVNPAWTMVLGYAPEELIGHHVNEFVLPEDHHETTEAYELAAEGGRPVIENRYRHKDGSVRWISWVAAPEGNMTYATGRHVSAEKEREAELALAQEQLRQSQKMEAVGQLTGGLAHDFNNLLTGIMGNLELLQKNVASGRLDSIDRFVNAAQGAGRRAAALTHRLLAFSRQQTLDPKPTDVNRLIAGMEELIRRSVGPAVDIEVVGAAGLWPTLIDPGQLENALLNLAINGRDAMPDGGRLTIETANRWLDGRTGRERDLPPGQYLSICVTDTGTGMTPEVIARAFDPFYTTKPLGEGTGLGLSMIYGFARQSGGQIRIYSEVGTGTTMCIYLPRHVGDEPADAGSLETADALDTAKGETILVIDDEPTIRHLIDEVLDEQGYTVIGAADGAAGLKVLQSSARIELLITDVGLPGGMNGRQVADAARVLRPGLKVLFITGYAENAAVGNGHLDPGMELLTKPFSLDDLARRVSDLITKRV